MSLRHRKANSVERGAGGQDLVRRNVFIVFSWRSILLFASLFLTGCQLGMAAVPTRIAVADTPVVPEPTPVAATTAEPELPTIEGASETATPTSEVLPTPAGKGVRPDRVQQQWVRDVGPEAPADWRPPTYDVPLSVHPDDHYWLIRPISSGRRNYDLEWYPYGNDVLLSALAPYRIHHGIDLPNERGTPVLAAGSGTVVHAGALPSPRNGVNYYGNTVVIQHDWQWQGRDVFTLYAHTLELFVEVGEHVAQGELVAGVGSSGEVSSSHLHFEVRVGKNNYGDTRNPALWLAPYQGWGTLAGRFVDRRGRFIPGATLTVEPVDVDTPVRVQRTYDLSVRSDDVWRENFVVGDLPAGRYELRIAFNGITYSRDVTVLPGRTVFEIISTSYEFTPLPTPEPTATPVLEQGQ